MASTTPAERRALLFLSALLCLGVAVRAAGAVRREPPPAESRAALARQVEAVDSARREGKRRKSRCRGSGVGCQNSLGTSSNARPTTETRTRRVDRAGRAERTSAVASDVPSGISPIPDTRHPAPAVRAAVARSSPAPAVPVVDIDTASAATLERLPRIGPALAQRIVEERDRNGPFGSIEGLQRVRGVGPGVARALGERVTFSGSRRLLRAAIPLDRAPR